MKRINTSQTNSLDQMQFDTLLVFSLFLNCPLSFFAIADASSCFERDHAFSCQIIEMNVSAPFVSPRILLPFKKNRGKQTNMLTYLENTN